MKFCDMEEEVYQDFDFSTPDENPMYETGEGSELTEIKFLGTFDEVRKQSQMILRLTGSKMSFNHDATVLGVEDIMQDSVGTMIPKDGEDVDETLDLQKGIFHEIEIFRQSGDGFGRVLDLSSRDGLRLCEYMKVQEHVDPRANIGECECGAILSALVDDKTQQYDTLISFCGLQTYQRGEQRKILLDTQVLKKSVLIVQGPLRSNEVDVSVEINFVYPKVKMVTVGKFFIWYYDQYTLRQEKDVSKSHWQDALKTIYGEPVWDEGYELKRVVLVGIEHYKCVGMVDTIEDTERCIVDVVVKYLETIPEALERVLVEKNCGDLNRQFLGVIHPREGESQLFVYGSYDSRLKQRGYVKCEQTSKFVGKLDGRRFKTGHLVKVLNLLVQMKILRYNLKVINQRKTYTYRLADGSRQERSFSEEWGFHLNSGLVSVHLAEEVAETDVIRCFGKLVQRYSPKKINLRSGNRIIGKAYRLVDNYYKVGPVIGEQYDRSWCNPGKSVVVVPMNDKFYVMAGQYLGLSGQEVKAGFLLLKGMVGEDCQECRARGESVFKRSLGNFEATEELCQELTRRNVIMKYNLMLEGEYSTDSR